MAQLNIITIDHKKYVLVPYAEYRLAEKGVPALPGADEQGNFPAIETTRALIARGIVRDREIVGMTQKELAAAAGIQPAVLNRIERGVSLPSMRTAKRIEAALARAGLKRDPRPIGMEKKLSRKKKSDRA